MAGGVRWESSCSLSPSRRGGRSRRIPSLRSLRRQDAWRRAMRLLAHRPKRFAQALGQELRLGDRGKVPAEVVFSPRGDVVVALRELTRWLGKRDSFAAEDADRCRNRRHISSRERRAGEVAMSPVRQQGRDDRFGGPVQREGGEQQLAIKRRAAIWTSAAPRDDLLANPRCQSGGTV